MWSKLLYRTTPGHVLSNNGLCRSAQHLQYVLLFLVLVVNSDQFQIFQSYTLLDLDLNRSYALLLVHRIVLIAYDCVSHAKVFGNKYIATKSLGERMHVFTATERQAMVINNCLLPHTSSLAYFILYLLTACGR